MTEEPMRQPDVSRREVMKKAGLASGALVIGSGAMAGSAAASNHEVDACVDENDCVVVDFDFRGTGSCPRPPGGQNFEVESTVTAQQTTQCRNPGGNIAPGQTTEITFSTSQTVQAQSGRVSGTQTACPDDSGTGTCPNPSWTPIREDLQIQSVTTTLTRAGNNTVCRSETISPVPDC